MSAARITRRSLLHRIGAGAALAVVPGVRGVPLPSSWTDDEQAGRIVRLDRNENALGASPRAVAALREAAGRTANRYPGQEIQALQKRLSDLHSVEPDQIVLGCGSTELLRIAIDRFAGPQRKVVVAAPTFELIARFADAAGAEVAAVPLAKNYSHDLDAMAARVDERTSLVYVCNPNNPTGSVTPRRALESFIAHLPGTARVLIDEAYHHYVGGSSDYSSFIDHPTGDPRLIVTRSFSAIHGLAGLRVGYAVAAPDAARLLRSHPLPDSVSSLAARAALAALEDVDYVRASAASNADRRQEFLNQANARMLRAIDSHANFVMFNTQHNASEVVAHFSSQGVLICGPFPGFGQSVRVSLGTTDEMREFWRVWDLKYGHAM